MILALPFGRKAVTDDSGDGEADEQRDSNSRQKGPNRSSI
jgi:hypothetical protein